MDVEIKQEIASDDEYCPSATENLYAPENNEYCPVPTEISYPPVNNDAELGHLDIKLEPEDIVDPFVELPPYEDGAPYGDPPPLTITINGKSLLPAIIIYNINIISEFVRTYENLSLFYAKTAEQI